MFPGLTLTLANVRTIAPFLSGTLSLLTALQEESESDTWSPMLLLSPSSRSIDLPLSLLDAMLVRMDTD